MISTRHAALEANAPSGEIAAPAARLPERARFYHAELDGLRFLAFFAVFVYHTLPRTEELYVGRGAPRFLATALSEISRTGRFGVDLFFVLSGYLITELLLREHDLRGRVDIRAFYFRRALRIWPIYFLVVAMATVVGQMDPTQPFRPQDAAWFLLFCGNWAIGLGIVHPGFVIPLWTINVEEQFYLFWPWFLRRPSPVRVLRIAAVLIGLAFVARFLWAFVVPPAWRGAVGNDTFAHLDAIAGGGALAVILRRRPPLSRRQRQAFLLIGLALALTAGAFRSEGARTVLVVAPLAAAGCVAIFVGVLDAGHLRSPLKNDALVFLGRISYGLYVYHYVMIVTLARVFDRFGALKGLRGFATWWCACLGATLVAAALSHRFIERPFMSLKRRFTYVPSRP